MPTDTGVPEPIPAAADGVIDRGLLSPVTVGVDALVSDAAIADALILAEIGLVRAWASVGVAPRADAEAVSAALGWRAPNPVGGTPTLPSLALASTEREALLRAMLSGSAAGGNPVIALVAPLRELAPAGCRAWIHRGATSQDILDSALMLVSRRAAAEVAQRLRGVLTRLDRFAEEHRSVAAAARTLTQHAVPTTVGLRTAGWAAGIRRALAGLDAAVAALPAQLGGAGGTLAAPAEIGGADAARALPAALARELGLAAPDAPWHTTRWPVTELGDALTRVLDALGVFAADTATLSRTEIGELAEGDGGGSSAMPQKRNPVGSILIRSAALRAPQLGATLHLAAALAVDERPDGAWHAEWPTLRELLRLTLGASAHAERLASGLRLRPEAVARNLSVTGGLLVAERVALAVTPLIGAERFRDVIAAAGSGADLATLLRAQPELAGLDLEALVDPHHYLGLAPELTDALLTPSPASSPADRANPAGQGRAHDRPSPAEQEQP
ncbi:lyase family protein [Leucobacter sp. M11]|uniref:lyase family protein n=1 Tax=Leucobacter sp. M11 TaxID=2993565 RepID=UPI002D7F061E|nr:lyase family protein [Leucobacter sp. M11]MEB4613308.1 lyase family protein [Leucobacter sp. M11]